ncbi:MAG TPA: class I SAM-dependent methyltransferase [Saprospiraceae bacterium]|nr:class I SAM-dependent methyltransferase [Saprospiraceae bacterium]
MSFEQLKKTLGKMDIYLLDQILKGRFLPEHRLLDAGCGNGRNLYWFTQNEYHHLYGIDQKASCIDTLKKNPLLDTNHFEVAKLENLSFQTDYFDRIICNAVLHFATSKTHFFEMLSEIFRVLKPGGVVFIRMTSIFGLEGLVKDMGNGNYQIPDGSKRFLLTNQLLKEWQERFPFDWVEPLKTVNVDNIRAMSTLVVKMKGANK